MKKYFLIISSIFLIFIMSCSENNLSYTRSGNNTDQNGHSNNDNTDVNKGYGKKGNESDKEQDSKKNGPVLNEHPQQQITEKVELTKETEILKAYENKLIIKLYNMLNIKDGVDQVVLINGKTRVGKSTFIQVMNDPKYVPPFASIYAQTVLPSSVNQKVDNQNIVMIDTPGYFEIKTTEKRDNNEISFINERYVKLVIAAISKQKSLGEMKEITNKQLPEDLPGLFEAYINECNTYKKKAKNYPPLFAKIESILNTLKTVIAFSIKDGLKEEDISSFGVVIDVWNKFISDRLVKKIDPIILVTRAEDSSQEEREQWRNQLLRHPKLLKLAPMFLENEKLSGAKNQSFENFIKSRLFFMGATSPEKKEQNLEEEIEFQVENIKQMSEIIKTWLIKK